MSTNKIYYTTQKDFCQGVFRIFLFFVSAVRDLLLIVVEKLAKTLEVDNLALPEELDNLVDVGIVAQAKNVVVGCASLLLCRRFASATFFLEIPVNVDLVLSAVRLLGVDNDLLDENLNQLERKLPRLGMAADNIGGCFGASALPAKSGEPLAREGEQLLVRL